MEFSEAVHQRRSIKSYQSNKEISDIELKELMREVVLSPSSFNLQHWKFIAVRDSDLKEKIKDAAWGQVQVGDCSVLLVICGKLNAHEDAPEIYKARGDTYYFLGRYEEAILSYGEAIEINPDYQDN